jgi:hypothetical protein
MNDFLDRQLTVMLKAVADFRAGRIQLNDLVQHIEGVSDVIQMDAWNDRIYPVVLALEQINAMAIDARRGLTVDEGVDVAAALSELEAHVQAFRAGLWKHGADSEPSNVRENKAKGDKAEDEVVADLEAAGRQVDRQVRKDTPFGPRVIGIEVKDKDGNVLGGQPFKGPPARIG